MENGLGFMQFKRTAYEQFQLICSLLQSCHNMENSIFQMGILNNYDCFCKLRCFYGVSNGQISRSFSEILPTGA